MNIIQCLLDSDNPIEVLGTPLSERILHQNKQHLWEERESGIVNTVVIHYMSAVERQPADPYNIEEILAIFCEYSVSSHYLIDRAGCIRQLVPEEKKAWHSGASIMPEPDSRQGVNDFSIGIELIGMIDSGFTDAQYQSLALLCRGIESRWNIISYVGHQDIAGKRAVELGLRSDIKTDPGLLFDWQRFYNLKKDIVPT